MKTGANTQCYGDRYMLGPGLPTDSCGSWSEAWREKLSRLDLSPVSPAWCPQGQQLLTTTQKTEVLHSSLATRTGCSQFATDSTDSAACLEAGVCIVTFACLQSWDKSPPNSIFLLAAAIRRLMNNMPIAYATSPCQTVPMWATKMAEHELLFTLLQ